jgi:DNA-binding response OmpR family regulator
MAGEDVAEAIKSRANLPIIILSAISEVASKTTFLERFAEDYLTKPFHYAELRARIDRVLLRLQDRLPAQVITVEPGLKLALRRREAVVDGRRIRLTPIETRFLATLLAAEGGAVSTERMLSRVWPGADGADPSYVWVTMRRLREKLETDPSAPRFLHTQRPGGYRLGAPGPDPPDDPDPRASE